MSGEHARNERKRWEEEVADLRAELATLHAAATALYEAGLWRIHESPIGTREEDRLWEVMRAALGRDRL